MINPLFTDVAFRRDSEEDGSGHYESGGSCPPPVPSAICMPACLTVNTRYSSIFMMHALALFCLFLQDSATLVSLDRNVCGFPRTQDW